MGTWHNFPIFRSAIFIFSHEVGNELFVTRDELDPVDSFIASNIKFLFLSGHVYGERALEAQALQNEGQVICPRTKEIYSFKDAEKVYIM